MIVFYLVAAALTLASLLFVLLPLWRANTPVPDKRRDANIAVYHQRYAEIEREVAGGRMTHSDAEQEKDALGARLLADIDAPTTLTGPTRTARRPWLASSLVACVLVGGAAAVYWQIGDYAALSDSDMPDIATMMHKLQQRVDAAPDDLEARAMLAQVQQAGGDYAGAARNYAAINAVLASPRAPILVAQAEATLRATDDLQGQAADLFQRALAVDASSPEALWYLGLAAAERGDNNQAAGYWDRLLKQDLPKDFADMVRNRRNELSGRKPGLKNS